ncbi:hypothetical protein JTM18_36970, partial [Pseudomonas aeruginosa]|nr:hypothetical protein [Pseudomonas aeruginosa]
RSRTARRRKNATKIANRFATKIRPGQILQNEELLPIQLKATAELDDLRSPLRGIASLVIALRFRGGKLLKPH